MEDNNKLEYLDDEIKTYLVNSIKSIYITYREEGPFINRLKKTLEVTASEFRRLTGW